MNLRLPLGTAGFRNKVYRVLIRRGTTDEVREVGELQVGGRGRGDGGRGGVLFVGLGLRLAADLGQEGAGLLGRKSWCGIGALEGGFWDWGQ